MRSVEFQGVSDSFKGCRKPLKTFRIKAPESSINPHVTSLIPPETDWIALESPGTSLKYQ